jgi:hypothetical protein
MNNDIFYGLLRKLKTGKMPENISKGVELVVSNNVHNYSLSNNLLVHTKSNRIVIPESKKAEILKLSHDHPMAGHMGVKNTHNRITTSYFWPGMKSDIERFVASCDHCQKRKKKKESPEISSAKIVPKPFYHIGIDVVGPLPITLTGKRYIVVAIDFFTKWVEARAVAEASAHEITQFIYEELICRHGIPNEITSDRGTEFVNELIESLTLRYKIKHIRTTSYHPQGNGQTERTNRTLKDVLSKLADKKLSWDFYLPSALFALRTIQQESIQFSPAEVLYGRKLRDQTVTYDLEVAIPVTWEKAIWNHLIRETDRIEKIRQDAHGFIIKSQERQRKEANKSRKKETPLAIGDQVLLYKSHLEVNWSAKLEPKWEGPYFVQRIKGTSFWLRYPNGIIFSSPVHRNRLKKYHPQNDL